MDADLFYRVQVGAGPARYDLSHDLTTLEVEEREGKPSRLVVQVPDPFKVFGHAIQEGMSVEAELGTVRDHSLVFRGRVHQVDASFPRDMVPSVTIRAHDSGMRMGLLRRNRRWTGSLSTITSTIARDHGFHRQTIRLQGDPSFSGNGLRQQDETDLAFLYRLAGAYGAVHHVLAGDEGDDFVFLSERDVMTSEPEVTLHHGRSRVPNRLLSFQAEADITRIQLPRLYSGIDYESGKPSEVMEAPVEEVGDREDIHLDENMTAFREREPERAKALQGLLDAAPVARREVVDELGRVQRITVPTFASPEELKTRSANQFSTRVHGMWGSGTTQGIHSLRAQRNVRIEDVGGRFSGVWFLSQVRHLLGPEGYRTELTCRR